MYLCVLFGPLYGSETWATTKIDMTRLEGAEIRCLRSVTGYTRLDKIRSEVIRKELEISGIQDVRLKYKQNWINHLEKNGQHQNPETRPQLQTSRKKRSWTSQEMIARRRCRNRSNDLIHGGRWWWWWWWWWLCLDLGTKNVFPIQRLLIGICIVDVLHDTSWILK